MLYTIFRRMIFKDGSSTRGLSSNLTHRGLIASDRILREAKAFPSRTAHRLLFWAEYKTKLFSAAKISKNFLGRNLKNHCLGLPQCGFCSKNRCLGSPHFCGCPKWGLAGTSGTCGEYEICYETPSGLFYYHWRDR